MAWIRFFRPNGRPPIQENYQKHPSTSSSFGFILLFYEYEPRFEAPMIKVDCCRARSVRDRQAYGPKCPPSFNLSRNSEVGIAGSVMMFTVPREPKLTDN